MEEKETQFKPLGPRVVVVRKRPVSGLAMSAEMEREGHPDIGTIVKVGQIGWWNKYVRGIRVGKKVCFTKYSPVIIREGEVEHMFVQAENILGIEND